MLEYLQDITGVRHVVGKAEEMSRLILLATSLAVLCDGAFLSTELACPQGGYITRAKFCEESPGCPNGEDSDTIYPHGPCIKGGDKSLEYRFACSGSGDVVPLEAMCNGSVECTNGEDETHAFCPSKRTKRCSCQNGGLCDSDGYCVCQEGFVGDLCQYMTNGAGGDPHFLVNLPDNSNLCFSLQGEPGFAFNLVTSEIIVMNAVFIDAPPRLQDWTTVIGEIGILYHTKSRSTLKIHFNFKDKSIYVSGYGVLDAKRVSSVVLKGDSLQVTSGNVTHSWASIVQVSVGDELRFKVFFNHDNLDIVWSDVSRFNYPSHGILGQFFNKGIKIDKERRELILPKRSAIPVILEDPKHELHHKKKCWLPRTPGYQGEGLIEGDYSEYMVDSIFATAFTYSLTSSNV